MSSSKSVVRTMLFGIGGSLAVLVIGFGLIIVNVLGGLDDLVNGDGPHEDDPAVVAAFEAASESLTPVVPTVQAALPSAAPVDAKRPQSLCTVGQHNWKIDDDYDLVCELIHVDELGLPAKASFRADMVALDAALMADGWVAAGAFDMERVLVDYWDELVSPARPAYSMDDLPAASYSMGPGDERRRLAVAWNEPSPSTYAIVLTQSVEYFRE